MKPEISESKVSMSKNDWGKVQKDIESYKAEIGNLNIVIDNLKSQINARDAIITRMEVERKKIEADLKTKYETTLQSLRAKERELNGYAVTQQDLQTARSQLKVEEEKLIAYARVLTFIRSHVLEINETMKMHTADERIKILQAIVSKEIMVSENVNWAGLSTRDIEMRKKMPVADDGPESQMKVKFKTVDRSGGKLPPDEEPVITKE
jgi:chromosome segregation ATPase